MIFIDCYAIKRNLTRIHNHQRTDRSKTSKNKSENCLLKECPHIHQIYYASFIKLSVRNVNALLFPKLQFSLPDRVIYGIAWPSLELRMIKFLGFLLEKYCTVG